MVRKKGVRPREWPTEDKKLFEAGLGRKTRRSRSRVKCVSKLSDATKRGIVYDYGMSLGWLRDQDLLRDDQNPHERWSRELVERMAVDMIETGYSLASVHTRCGRLKRALGLMAPNDDLAYFDELLREFDRPAIKRETVVWRVTSADLFTYGVELMEHAGMRSEGDRLRAADLYRSGLQIALLACRPWRRRTFTLLELWRHVTKEGSDWRMRVEAKETKHRRSQSAQVPQALIDKLETYLSVHYPRLRAETGYTENALWLSRHGRPQSPADFSSNVRDLLAERFGERITPHTFRKIAATTIALHFPEEVHSIQGVLGHAGPEMGEAYYNLANDVVVHNELQRAVDAIGRRARAHRRLSEGKAGWRRNSQ